ncbi:hypothetical protein HYPSUDRAFT_208201 [Hypholoma sublateritium FD-334 SS-4]|uniref:Uncharacterized protein n=1 Tax=Hypholoma sublateritium (strain FD-334 SS-4) TaxID=945553 RepID=A0A0D2LVZ1_HYPSF|nr:hypothetical protein HYPSUDRAFT_208201 [Hypholoma sublateritium FD-334 SS-4]
MASMKKKKSRSPRRKLHPVYVLAPPPPPLVTWSQANRMELLVSSASPQKKQRQFPGPQIHSLWDQGSSPLRRRDHHSVTPVASGSSAAADSLQESQSQGYGGSDTTYTQSAIQSAMHLDWGTAPSEASEGHAAPRAMVPAPFPAIPALSVSPPPPAPAALPTQAIGEDEIVSRSETEVGTDTKASAMQQNPTAQPHETSAGDLSNRLVHNIEHLLAGLHKRHKAEDAVRILLEKEVEQLQVALERVERDQRHSDAALQESNVVKLKLQRERRAMELEVENLKKIRILERDEARGIQDELRAVGNALDASLKRLVKLASATEYYV